RRIKKVAKITKSRNTKKDILKMSTFTAEHIRSWIAISPMILYDLIPLDHYECWMMHMEAWKMLFTYEISVDQISVLQGKWDNWRELFKKQFSKQFSNSLGDEIDDDDENDDDDLSQDINLDGESMLEAGY